MRPLELTPSPGPAEPLSALTAASLTYEPYYGLREKPFSLSADPRFLFKSPSHAPAFEQILEGIRRREGLIVLTGEIGTGKTTLCRAVLGHLDRRTFSTFVPDPFVSREDLLKMLLVDFGVMSIDDVKSGRLRGASRPELSYPLYEFLNSLVPLQAFAVLVIDEAQNLPLPLLEEIRILSELERREKLLQVVLVGQPELRTNLKLPEMRQVDQRVSVRCELASLDPVQVIAYVTHRLNIAWGGTCDGVRFTAEALEGVGRASGGTPRLINLICDRALHEGYVRRTRTIDADAVASALAHLALPGWPGPPVLRVAEPAIVATAAPAARPDPLKAIEDSVALSEFGSESSARYAPAERPWYRRALVALLPLLLAAVGAPSWYLLATRASDVEGSSRPTLPANPLLRTSRPLGAVVPPPPPAQSPQATGAPRYVIQVASFESDWRAGRLVARLAAAGFRAGHTQFVLDTGDPWWEVSVGPYSTLAEARTDLDQIRQIPGYEDATLRERR